ncbi:glycoside hydrolase family 43 protein [Actinoalloteichus hymeniacidonis]|uniref:Glycosyl hydrolase family 43 n=1 Tax=Actinoalloteichus hymeniacidonis TaxID=340345 RepID=A0AAC9HTP6_9PSEU|nr:glycoside hydrolase 43 family protein [Actinoalloteichus hymeniacidonis]AOS64931.1 glycosyl hydrolase family 43 [Actinoalloteichus hymeniacidonis]MBB5906994.1 hypothetical protein [Actinoalloteichus hymeniacidonis]
MSNSAEPTVTEIEGDEPPWVADLGDGTYRNPVLFTDLSDPDVIRVGEDFYLVASTFACVPGLVLATSRNLVDWRLIANALPEQQPTEVYATPQPGKGVWAPALRHHAGRFYIFYGDPDFGIRVLDAEHIEGPWSEPRLIKPGLGLIDPCPFWDADGTAYLVHGWAASRSGIKNRLTLHRMNEAATELLDDGHLVIDGDQVPGCNTLEGPKLYRRGDWYYIFAPAGGVATGWQSVFRSRSIDGPYEHRIVLAQRDTEVNGPHQGAWVDTPAGEDWFLHFQDRGVYGRIVHLQPMQWLPSEWPVIGVDPDENGCGRPVLVHPKPALPSIDPADRVVEETFAPGELGPQWSWQANPDPRWWSLSEEPGTLRLAALPEENAGDLRSLGQVLTRRMPAEEFVVTVDLGLNSGATEADRRGGVVVIGYDYAWAGIVAGPDGQRVVLRRRRADEDVETELDSRNLATENLATSVRIRLVVTAGGHCRFAVAGADGEFVGLGGGADAIFAATAGRWVGAKIGLFAVAEPAAEPAATEPGFLAVDRVRVTALPADSQ